MIPYGEGDYPVFSFEDGNCILLEYDAIVTVKLVIDKAQQNADIERMLYRTVLPEYVDLKHCPDCDVIPVKTGRAGEAEISPAGKKSVDLRCQARSAACGEVHEAARTTASDRGDHQT